jgi:hypothetical protein
VARAAKDGCTILSGTVNTVVLIPLLDAHAGFTPSDFLPVAKIGSTGLALIAGTQSGAVHLADLHGEEAGLGRPLAIGHPGNSTLQAFAIDSIEDYLGMHFTHVPYSGSAALVGDLIGGRLDLAVVAMPVAHRTAEADTASDRSPTSRRTRGGRVVERLVRPRAHAEANTASLRKALAAVLGDESVAGRLRIAGVQPAAPGAMTSAFRGEIATETRRYAHWRSSRVGGTTRNWPATSPGTSDPPVMPSQTHEVSSVGVRALRCCRRQGMATRHLGLARCSTGFWPVAAARGGYRLSLRVYLV